MKEDMFAHITPEYKALLTSLVSRGKHEDHK